MRVVLHHRLGSTHGSTTSRGRGPVFRLSSWTCGTNRFCCRTISIKIGLGGLYLYARSRSSGTVLLFNRYSRSSRQYRSWSLGRIR
jgi:hypothetical protein